MLKIKCFTVTTVLALSSLSYAGQIDVVNETKKEINDYTVPYEIYF